MDPRGPLNIYFCLWTPSLMLWTTKGSMDPRLGTTVLVAVLKDILLRLNLSLSSCRGQCYDGAANMAGCRNENVIQICREEERDAFKHCYGHALNLAVADTIKQNIILRHVLDTVGEISKLLKYSPRRDVLVESMKSTISPSTTGFRTLCPAR